MMGISTSLQEVSLEAMREIVRAANILLPVYDLDHSQQELYPGQPRMGYPAATLLFCFIENVGHLLTTRKIGPRESFEILREPVFENQPLTKNQCQKLYDDYRCRLCHNVILPKGFLIDCNPFDSTIFYISDKDFVASVNLYALLQLCTKVMDKIGGDHDRYFSKSFAMRRINKSAK